MDECYSHREIDATEYNIDLDRVLSIGSHWGVSITKEGKVRIPVCSYGDILPLIRRRPR